MGGSAGSSPSERAGVTVSRSGVTVGGLGKISSFEVNAGQGSTGVPGVVDRRSRPALVLAGLILVMVAFLSSHLQANGGKPRLKKVEAGPYLVSVWTQPDPSRTGRIDVSVAVTRAPTAEPVEAAEVRLRAEALTGRGTVTAALERGAGGSRLLYHGNLELPSEGLWRVTVAVEGPAGTGQTAFELDVRASNSLAWLLIIGGTVVSFAAAAGGLWWLWARTARRARLRADLT